MGANWKKRTAGLAMGLALAAGAYGQELVDARPDGAADAGSTGMEQLTGGHLFEKVDPVLVAIQHERAGGSGFIVSEDGYILTNGHVISGAMQGNPEDPKKTAERITVILHNEKKYRAKVIGHCLDPDVALLKIRPEEPLAVATFADSTKVQSGDRCFAFGMPTGLKRTLTSGILSNVERTDLGTFTKVFQTDAAINPGNSGGPLFNERGEVLGLNTYGFRGSNNLGFTVPIHVAKVLKDHYLEHGYFRRATIPFVAFSEIYDELGEALGVEKGVLIDHVEPGSKAESFGLRSGDVLTAVDGEPVSARTEAQLLDFNWSLVTREVGSTATLTVMRREGSDWKKKTVQAVFHEDEPAPRIGNQIGEIPEHRNDLLGLGTRRLVTLARIAYGLPRDPGVWVTTVGRGSPFQRAGLQPNDILLTVEGEPVGTPQELEVRLEKLLLEKPEGIRLEVRRFNTTFRTAVSLYYPLDGKRIAVCVPEEGEYVDLVRQYCITAGAQTVLATRDGRNLTLWDGRSVSTRKLSSLSADKLDACILLEGDENRVWEEKEVASLIRGLHAAKKGIGAVGGAVPAVIGAEKELADKKVTTAEEFSDRILKAKGTFTGKSVETDGKLVTSTGADKDTIRAFLTAFRRMM